MDRVSLIEIGEMHFDGRKRHCLDHIVQCHARKAVARRINDGTINVVHVQLKRIHEDAFVIGLLNYDFDTEFRSESANLFVDELQRFQSINIRFTPAEQICVGAVQHQKSQPAAAIGSPSISIHKDDMLPAKCSNSQSLTVSLRCHGIYDPTHKLKGLPPFTLRLSRGLGSYFLAFPALMMSCKSFSFSLQMYSNKSVSRTSSSLIVRAQGFVYTVGSSTVTSTSRLP